MNMLTYIDPSLADFASGRARSRLLFAVADLCHMVRFLSLSLSLSLSLCFFPLLGFVLCNQYNHGATICQTRGLAMA
jgi:hypothetical protein